MTHALQHSQPPAPVSALRGPPYTVCTRLDVCQYQCCAAWRL